MEKLVKNAFYRTGTYLRISKEDVTQPESESIANQRDLIRHFVTGKPDIRLLEEYIDDGFSGSTFERPAFQQMIADVRIGKINCIIVKDLSRLGRNFIETGRYIDQFFPAYGIRFIAINDNFDSAERRSQSDHILLPFINLVNDAFCRDISIKVRSQLEIKRKKGEFIGSFAAFGYLKDPDNHHKLMVDTFAANVVKDIFRWKIDGASQQRIADRLNAYGILSPMEYKRYCGLDYRSGFQKNLKAKWSAVAVGRILHNEIYIGTLVQGKRTTPNHKIKKTIDKPSKDWVRVASNHEAIISTEDFSTVQRLLLQDTRIAPEKECVSLFSGLLFCGDCGWNMVKNTVKKSSNTYSYYMCCQNRTAKRCGSHRIPEQAVTDAVLLSLNQQIAYAVQMEHIHDFIASIPRSQQELQKTNLRIQRKQEEMKRYQKLKNTLYPSLTEGLIDQQEYLELKTLYDLKCSEAETAQQILVQELDNVRDQRTKASEWMHLFKQHHKIPLLTRRIAVTFIDKIRIYEDARLEIQFQFKENNPHPPYRTDRMQARTSPLTARTEKEVAQCHE